MSVFFSIQDETTKQVVVRGKPSCVRNIMIKDETDELEVALWRTSAESTATLGDWVQISNVVLNEANQYHTEPFVATTQTTKVTVSLFHTILNTIYLPTWLAPAIKRLEWEGLSPSLTT